MDISLNYLFYAQGIIAIMFNYKAWKLSPPFFSLHSTAYSRKSVFTLEDMNTLY